MEENMLLRQVSNISINFFVRCVRLLGLAYMIAFLFIAIIFFYRDKDGKRNDYEV